MEYIRTSNVRGSGSGSQSQSQSQHNVDEDADDEDRRRRRRRSSASSTPQDRDRERDTQCPSLIVNPSTSTRTLHPLPPATPSPPPLISFAPLPSKSLRTALILDRFSSHCPVMYCSNDLLLPASSAIGHSFYDWVVEEDEGVVRSWVDLVKGWGVNEFGQPSDGGFGFGRFGLRAGRRESV